MVTKSFFPKSRTNNFSGIDITAIATVLLFMTLFVGAATPVSAHTTVHVENIAIDAGWGIEPPIVGIRNDFVFKVTTPGDTEGSYKGISSAFKNLEMTAMYGGATKKIDVNSDPKPGYYFSPVIPTKTGTITIDVKGEIDGAAVDVQIPIEDVESTSILDFPPVSDKSSDSDVVALKNAISSLQREMLEIKSGSGIEISGNSSSGTNYDFAVFGMSLGAAGVVLAIISMVRKKEGASCLVNQDKMLIVSALVVGVAVFGILITFIGQGEVRHVEIFLTEQVKQTVAFQDVDDKVMLVGVSGTGEANNPTLVTRVSFEYVLTVVNQGDQHHRLYVDEMNVQTDLLAPGEEDTITIIPSKEGTYNYYDKRENSELLGQIKAVIVSPDEKF